jgi:GDP-L-fucose synthase
MLLVQLQSYRAEYGFNGVFVLPANLYGPRDNFDPQSSHVIPALIKKVAAAKDFVEVWGDGTPTREFLYVDDAARGIVATAERYASPEPMNLGTGEEVSIKVLVQMIADALEFKGEVRWDPSKPNGQPRRRLDTTRAQQEIGFKPEVSLREGLRRTIDWYMDEAESRAK